MKKNTYLAKTFHGLEPILAQEMEALGLTDIKPVRRGVLFSGEQADVYRANLWLRTALRILVPIHEFEARDEKSLYRGVQDLNWSQYLRLQQTFVIDTTVKSEIFTHSHFVALKAKDAIVDQFRRHTGQRPSIDTQSPDVRVHLYVNDRQVRVMLDSSGETLHRRGYRQESRRAPLNEVLAAGMLYLSGWQPGTPLIDPMCGSGTLPIEAALISARIAPGLIRRHFGFAQWTDYDRDLWQGLLKEARQARQPIETPIYAREEHGPTLGAARRNATDARVERYIQFDKADFLEADAPPQPGLLIMNPPYGERMGSDIEALYRAIGDTFKQRYAGYQAWIVSSNLDALKRVGLKPFKKYTLYNGQLPVKFQGYELYAGKKEEG